NDNGDVALWQMRGDTATGGVTILKQGILGSAPPSSHVVAVNDFDAGDFGGQPSADILFQKSDGSLTVWGMDSFAQDNPTKRVLNVEQNPGAPWHVVASGDFDGDGRAGIVLRADTGEAAIWEGFTRGATVVPTPRFATQGDLQNNGPTWQV